MEIAIKQEPAVESYLSKIRHRVSYTFLRSLIRFKKRFSNFSKSDSKLNPMQEIALEIIKKACASSETELHTFLLTGYSQSGRVYILVNKKMEMKIYWDGRTQIITEEEFCDTRFPDSVAESILNMVAKKMDSKRRIMEKNMESRIQKRFKTVLEDLKK
jgi:Cft2 family RNA processing exonuclease